MADKRDYYEILGLDKNASIDEIKKAYREAALKYHPDRAPVEKKAEAEEHFKEVSEAYAVLSNPQKRSLYDHYGHAGISQKYASEDIFRDTDFESVLQGMRNFGFGSSIFDQFFGGGFDFFGTHLNRDQDGRGADIEIAVEITLEEAAIGLQKQISFPDEKSCETCRGSGARPGTQPQACESCKGTGMNISSRGNVQIRQTCKVCHGTGTIIKTPCAECRGKGRVQSLREINLNIPVGVDTGSRLRLKGEGHAGPKERGDLFVILQVAQHPLFERLGANLVTEKHVRLTTAVLGGEVEVPTLKTPVTLKIPAGTQSGKMFRLKGKGMPFLRGKGVGDELVRVIVDIPTALTPAQRKLMESFARLSG